MNNRWEADHWAARKSVDTHIDHRVWYKQKNHTWHVLPVYERLDGATPVARFHAGTFCSDPRDDA